MEYRFTKDVRHERLVTLLKASTFSVKVSGLKVELNQVIITTNAELTVPEAEELNSIMANYSDFSIEEIYRKNLELSKKFGNTLIDDFGIRNLNKGYTEAQKFQVVADIRDGFLLLTTGSLATFLYWLDNVFVPTELVTIDDVEFFKSEVMDFLNTL